MHSVLVQRMWRVGASSSCAECFLPGDLQNLGISGRLHQQGHQFICEILTQRRSKVAILLLSPLIVLFLRWTGER